MKTKEQILKWLKSQLWYEQWLENWEKRRPEIREREYFWERLDGFEDYLIQMSFPWDTSNPGFDFWNNIDKEYKKWLMSK